MANFIFSFRSYTGLENVNVCDYMLAARDNDQFITGRSVHNQRIGRLWRDAYEPCFSSFYQTFRYVLSFCKWEIFNFFFINRRLEDQNILDPDNDLYIFVFHHLAHLLMSNTADKWLKGWNEHGISTERNMTPVAMPALTYDKVIESCLVSNEL